MLPAFDKTAPFIWAAYGVAALTLSGLAAAVLARLRRAKRALEAAERLSGDEA